MEDCSEKVNSGVKYRCEMKRKGGGTERGSDRLIADELVIWEDQIEDLMDQWKGSDESGMDTAE